MLNTPLTANNTDVLLLVNETGEITYASPSCADVFGVVPEGIVGQSTLRLLHSGDRKRARRAFQAVLAKPNLPRDVEIRVLTADGSWCWSQCTISNCGMDSRIGGILVHCRDISRRNSETAAYQRQNEDQLRTIARLQDCLYAVAHDFREPLRTISAFTSLLLRHVDLDAESSEYARHVATGIDRMSDLFEDTYRSASERFDEPFQPVDLRCVVESVVLDLQYLITTGDATVKIGPLPEAMGNEKYFVRVFQNLIANAIKYRGERPAIIEIWGERLGPVWVIKVKDEGVGIAKEHHKRIFRLSERLHGQDIEGRGIGLAICQTIVEAMGGSIWVESAPGCGSVFCLTVAPAEEAGVGSATPDGDRYSSAGDRKRLAIAPAVQGIARSPQLRRLGGN